METIKKTVQQLAESSASYNPRIIKEDEFKALKKSIQEFGYIEPVIWNSQTNTVVGGHMRLQALLSLGRGEEEISVVVVDLTLEKEKALNLALNKISGEWDKQKLAEIFTELTPLEVELTGFKIDEIQIILNEFGDIGLPEQELQEINEKEAKEIICPACSHHFIK